MTGYRNVWNIQTEQNSTALVVSVDKKMTCLKVVNEDLKELGICKVDRTRWTQLIYTVFQKTDP